MCGIGGILGQPDAGTAKKMNILQRHRGPDGDQIFVDEHVALAHTRLAIVDIVGSPQPMHGPGNEVLVVNGEIYNHATLRHQLKSFPWKTSGDSESILALYHQAKRQGRSSLSAKDHAEWISRLDGMFAFALWDGDAQQLLLARDTLGIKPLVRTMIEGSLLFSSEHKALRADERHQPSIDMVAMSARLAFEYPLDATTLLHEIHQIRPGTVEVWKVSDGVATLDGSHRFETVQHSIQSWNPDSGSHELLESFTYSVEQRLMADVPVGIVLSGGLDSSLVAAVAEDAAERAGQPVPECWTVAESEDNPDYVAAQQVAASLDLVHHQYVIQKSDLDGAIQNLVWHGEDLDVTVVFFQPLFEKMQHKVTVGLCGQGADELHAGYPRYKNIPEHLQLIAQRLNQIDHPSANMLQQTPWPQDGQWYSEDHIPLTKSSALNDFLDFEINHGQLTNFQLRLVDRHSMAHALEVRVPFLGRQHRKVAMSLPTEWKLPNLGLEKLALRMAAAHTRLPQEIVSRPKLPAGTATTPTLLRQILQDYESQIEELRHHYRPFTNVLKHQKELALGLGLFEAMHIIDGGRTKKQSSIDQLISEVLP
jgi:asparagine synthase (glutamine-hydrolysing)